MIVLRRWLTLIAFAFWQGGFTFYTAVVVPIGTDVLGGPVAQGMITRHVAYWLNVAGAAAVLLLLWDAQATRPLRRVRLFLCLLLAAGLLGLALLHPRLDALLDVEAERVLNRATFYRLHRFYLWLCTAEWAVGVVYLLLTPLAWRRADWGSVTAGPTSLADR